MIQASYIKYILLTILTMVFLSLSEVRAEDLRKVVNLNGYWKFSIGTDEKWASPNFDDSDWDEIMVPRQWEHEGYNDYNGYAWYRKKVNISNIGNEQPLYLLLGNIDDANEVYFNGELIGKNGGFPPKYSTAWGENRRFVIPTHLIKDSGKNTIAVKVYDSHDGGGIVSGQIGIFIDEDLTFLDYILAGEWKFSIGDNKYWRTVEYDDSDWMSVQIPSDWESYGYPRYDGYGWYRKKFTMPNNLKNKEVYLSLGKIDDYDQVYFNGELIGNVFDLDKDGEYRARGWEYNARRVYEIPSKLIKDKNTIAVRVYDKTQRGGIYEGPIGIMTQQNYTKYKEKHHRHRTFWDYVYDEIF